MSSDDVVGVLFGCRLLSDTLANMGLAVSGLATCPTLSASPTRYFGLAECGGVIVKTIGEIVGWLVLPASRASCSR